MLRAFLCLFLMIFATVANATTTVVKAPDGKRDAIAVLVHCHPASFNVVVEDDGTALKALAELLAERDNYVVLLTQPTPEEIRTVLKELQPKEGDRYDVIHLVIAGLGYGSDLDEPRVVCGEMTDLKEVGAEQKNLAISIASSEIETLARGAGARLIAFYDASRAVEFPGKQPVSLGPVASQSAADFVLSAGEVRQFTAPGFIDALNLVLAGNPAAITAQNLTLALRRNVKDPTITVSMSNQSMTVLAMDVIGPRLSPPPIAGTEKTKNSSTPVAAQTTPPPAPPKSGKKIGADTGILAGVSLACTTGSIASSIALGNLVDTMATDQDILANYTNDAELQDAAQNRLPLFAAAVGTGLCGVGAGVGAGVTFVF